MKLDFDGTEYEIESLSEVGKNTVNSLQFVEGKISELSNKKAVYFVIGKTIVHVTIIPGNNGKK